MINFAKMKKNKNWQTLDPAAIIKKTGNSYQYKTGNWVPKNIEFIKKNCINCGMCWVNCPDDAIILDENQNVIGIDLDHCKKCGICTKNCPANKNPDPQKHALVFLEKK